VRSWISGLLRGQLTASRSQPRPSTTWAWATLGYTANLGDGSVLPIWLTFEASTRTFNGTPISADLCTLTMIVMATDQAGASERHVCADVGAWQLFLSPLFAT
jgi:hypothetical protein